MVCMQPKGRTSPRQTDGRLLPSSTEAVEALLARLKCSRQALDDWTDRLREWFAGQVLQPLTHLLDTAHLVRPWNIYLETSAQAEPICRALLWEFACCSCAAYPSPDSQSGLPCFILRMGNIC